MSKGDDFVRVSTGGKRLYASRVIRTGQFAGGPVVGGVKPEDNAVLRQLQGLRQENQTILERHVRDRELLIKLSERVEQGFENVRNDVRELRREVRELRSEVVSLENKLITNQNEILDIVRRIDEAEANPFEFFEVDPDQLELEEYEVPPEAER